MLPGNVKKQVEIVFGVGRRLAECMGTFEGLQEAIKELPAGTGGPGAHAFNRIQVSLLECMVMQGCGLFQKPSREDDASLQTLSGILADPNKREAVLDLRNSWYANLDYRNQLIAADRNTANAKIEEFRARLDRYELGHDIKRIRDKAIAHPTTAPLNEPLIKDVTGLADDALELVQLAHDIFDGGDSGLSRREIFKKSGLALAGGELRLS